VYSLLKTSFSERDFLSLSIRLACSSVRSGGGPFGAVIGDKQGRLLEFAQNTVIQGCDSTAHAEISVLRYLQQKLKTHNLSGLGLTLYSSADPCIQCFGAIYWSGITTVVSAISTNQVEAICGFKEGPVSGGLWRQASVDKGISFKSGALPESGKKPLLLYSQLNGKIY
jgi:tRNA(Arg) A34 adenosine deaminase TadA